MLKRCLLGPLVLTLMSCGDSKKTTVAVPIATLPVDLQQQYEDFNPTFNADGSKAAFISLRGKPEARVYLYDANAATKLVKYADKAPLAEGEQEWLTSLSADGNWVLAYREKSGAGRVVLGHFTGSSTADVTLPANSVVEEMLFAPNSQVFAIVQRNATGRTLRTFVLSGNETAVSVQELQSFANATHPRFVDLNGTLKLLAIDESTAGTRPIISTDYEAAGKTFSPANSLGTLPVASVDRSWAASSAGVFFVSALAAPRVREPLGEAATVATLTKKEKVVEEVSQNNVFGQDKAFDFPAIYGTTEPLNVFSISASTDGNHLLVASRDVYNCKKGVRLTTIYHLLRQTDKAVIPFVVGRKSGTLPWTSVVSDPCEGTDAEDQTAAISDFDRDGYNAQIISISGDKAKVMVESASTGDREVRVLDLTLEWNAKKVTKGTVTEISENLRP